MKFFYTLLLAVLFQNAFAQLPTEADDKAIREKIVELALQNYPTKKIKELEVVKAKKMYNYSWTTWTNNLRLYYNLNDRLYDPATTYNMPKYGAGLGINVGDIIALPSKTRIAKQELRIARKALTLEELQIKNEVLQRYNNYKTAEALYKLKVQKREEAKNSFDFITNEFHSGKVDLQALNTASLNYYGIQEEVIKAKNDLDNAKIEVEEYTNVPLETINAAISNP